MGNATAPTPHDHEPYNGKGYSFLSWNTSFSGITANTSVTAKYQQYQYRYRDQTTAVRTTNDAPAGGEFISSTTNYSAWSGWVNQGSWSTTKPVQPPNTQTEEYQIASTSAVTKTQWRYSRWVRSDGKLAADRDYGTGSSAGGPWIGPYYTPWFDSQLPYRGMSDPPDPCPIYGPYNDGAGSWSTYLANIWYNETTQQVTVTPAQYILQKRTRTITGYNVTYWTAWSAWSDNYVTATSTRQVQQMDK